MSEKKCRVCLAGRASEIDALLAGGLSLTKIAARTGLGRLVIWRHSKHTRDGENAQGGAQNELRRLLRDHRQLYQKAVRAGNLDVAARQLASVTDLELRLSTPPPKLSKPTETVWRVVYEDGSHFNKTEDANPYTSAVREALGFRQPMPSVRVDLSRADLAAQLDHQAQRETGKTALAMRILAKVLRNELSLDDEVTDETIQLLQNENASEDRDEGNGQAHGNDAA